MHKINILQLFSHLQAFALLEFVLLDRFDDRLGGLNIFFNQLPIRRLLSFYPIEIFNTLELVFAELHKASELRQQDEPTKYLWPRQWVLPK